MRIGLLGGSFDPIHLGHLRAAELAREACDLDRVLLIPAGVPPHRERPLSSAFDRYAMAALAAAENPVFEACALEVSRPGRSYTVDTLEALAATHPPATWFLVLGADAADGLGSWHRIDRVRVLAQVIVVGRPGRDAVADPESRGLPSTGLDVSSSAIRGAVRAGRSIRHLVPAGVADYVAKRRLYS